MNRRISAAASPCPCSRSRQDGCTVTRTGAPWGDSSSRPRWEETPIPRPRRLAVAVAPGRRSGADAPGQFRRPATMARPDLAGVWPRIQALLAALDKLEVLDGVGDVADIPLDAGLRQAVVEEAPCRTDEWAAGAIFGISRLFAHQHRRRLLRPLAMDHLSGEAVEIATRAGTCVGALRRQRPFGVFGETCRYCAVHDLRNARRRVRFPVSGNLPSPEDVPTKAPARAGRRTGPNQPASGEP